MKKFLSVFVLLMAMQMFSLNLEAQALNMNDEISYCTDVDVGEITATNVQLLMISVNELQTANTITIGKVISKTNSSFDYATEIKPINIQRYKDKDLFRYKHKNPIRNNYINNYLVNGNKEGAGVLSLHYRSPKST